MLKRAAAIVAFAILTFGASHARAEVTPIVGPHPIVSALPTGSGLPPITATAPPGQCGPTQNGPFEVQGMIVDPAIAQHASNAVYNKSTVIVYPVTVDPLGKYRNAVINAVTSSANMQQSANASSTSAQSIAAMVAFGSAQASLTGAYASIGTQSESAYLSATGGFACKGLAAVTLNGSSAPTSLAVQIIVTEFWINSTTHQTVTTYYQTTAIANSISALPVGGLPLLLIPKIGSVPKQ